jgi:hypothetical protein
MVLLVAIGCTPAGADRAETAGPQPTNHRLPVHRDLPVTPTGETSGLLVLEHGCVFLSGSGDSPTSIKRHLPIWQSDARLEGFGVKRGDELVATIGSHVHLFGGFLPLQAVRGMMDAEIPPDCDVGSYFVVAGNASPCIVVWVPGPDGKVPRCSTGAIVAP